MGKRKPKLARHTLSGAISLFLVKRCLSPLLLFSPFNVVGIPFKCNFWVN